MGKISVILIIENEVFSSGLSFYLEEVLKYELKVKYKNCLEFMKSKNPLQNAVVLFDFEEPGQELFEVIEDCIKLDKDLKFIALTNYEEKIYLKKIYDAGFDACVFKQNIYTRLEEAIKEVSNNRKFFPYNISELIKNKIGG